MKANPAPDREARAHILASFEFGVSPLLPADLYSAEEIRDGAWRICASCHMPYEHTPGARKAHLVVKEHEPLDAGPWTEVR
jgi:hypothetical protein